ncbi:unnamed protein product [Acanthoscelides obtectus]|uniref:Translocator protein n=1 Tax=Acanthoscelides obtectus TaxID=200917 RepID=A0A9P0KN06_ACAOB|nr:unnamed protein product [Acanthoscelides obtectus]CAK1669254.1 Translocator protein [Acanthoscelides obtectus]
MVDLVLIAFIIVPNLGGIIGGLVTVANLPWYEKLKKPDWRPPNWAFGPIWVVMYSLIGYSSYLIFKSGDWTKDPIRQALLVYGTDLLVNWLWTPIFFGLKNIKLALYDILLLDAVTVANALLFYHINSMAGYLYIPYMIWLVLATALNYEILRDNPDAQGIKHLEHSKVHHN